MSSQEQESRIAKYVISGVGIVGLVIVAWLDLAAEEQVSPFVYGALAGSVIGADNVIGWFKK